MKYSMIPENKDCIEY